MAKEKKQAVTEDHRINPARELRDFLDVLRGYKGNASVLSFFADRYAIKPPDQIEVMKRMHRDVALLDRAIKATESALGDRSDTFLQWTPQVMNAFRQLGMDTHLSQVHGQLGGYEVHLDYCIEQLDTVELSEDLMELLDLIDEFRAEAAAMSLSDEVAEAVSESLDHLERAVWDRAYGIHHDGVTLVGRIVDRLGRLKKLPPRLRDQLLQLAIRVCTDPETLPRLAEGAEHAKALLSA